MPSVNGLPSVSEIIRAVGLTADYSSIPTAYREIAMARGKALHAAIEMDAEGTLDDASVHEAIRAPLEAYRRFCKDVEHAIESTELELVDDRLGFCGHLDRVGTIRGQRAIIDWKLSDRPDLEGARYQLAGYHILDSWCTKPAESPQWYVVALRKDGTYRLHDLTDLGVTRVFEAALVVYQAIQRRGT